MFASEKRNAVPTLEIEDADWTADFADFEVVLSPAEVTVLEGLGHNNMELWCVTALSSSATISQIVNFDFARMWIEIEA